MTGLVLDLQRFALHDGPGIRTTVFLKGCPLRCLWCHNPESQALEPQLAYDPGRCTACPACAEARRYGLRLLQAGPLAVDLSDPEACAAACPHGAFRVMGARRSVEEVMEEVLRDADYFQRSGGGLTLSGGEPLAQFDFALALLQAAKAEGLHTCLDTCGATSLAKLAAVADHVDLFLYDYKATDASEHRRLTGATNARILSNLDYLYRRGARVRLRCPLVPGVNDSAGHLAGIAALSARYPDLEGVEVMPYHDLGRDKAGRIGETYVLPNVSSADDRQQADWLAALHTLGCTEARLG
jgi:glycyl-radical enzyme activating protein